MSNIGDGETNPPPNNEIENLVDDKISEKQDPPSPTEGSDYDPRPDDNKARRRIAYALIALLAASIVAIFTLLGLGIIDVAELEKFGVILSPLITLVSAATGFYYGTK